MIVTGHQLNFLPGLSVIEKIRAADAVVWMDEMQYERHGFVNRNRLADGTPMVVPVAEHDTYAAINRVRIGDPTGRGREKIARTLEQKLRAAAEPYARELRRPYRLLAGLNASLLRHLTRDLNIETEQHYQSHLGAGRYEATSNGLADMVAELGGIRSQLPGRDTLRGARHRGRILRMACNQQLLRGRADPFDCGCVVTA